MSARSWAAVVGVLVAFVLGDVWLGVSPPGLVAVFGFAGATLLTIAAKAYGKRVVYRPLDHRREPTVLPQDRLSGAVRDGRDGSVEGEADRRA